MRTTGPGHGWVHSRLVHAAIVVLVVLASVCGNTYWRSPPRFDGAGYAVLGLALSRGEGYREIDHPNAPRHAHYPPGYPLALAVVWTLAGPSAAAAHVFSAVCTLAACLAAWCWLRTLYRPGVALGLALALAFNWTWARAGGAIQSEPLFFLWQQLAILAGFWAARGASSGRALLLGIVLGACMLTRHVGACVAAAALADVWMRGRPKAAGVGAATALAIILPWVVWLALVRHNTQVALLAGGGLTERLAANAVFYMRRLPDTVCGPLVEVATVFGRSRALAGVATASSALGSAFLAWGWLCALRNPRRRLAGLVPVVTLLLLWVWPFTEAGRFLVPLVPFVLVGAIEALARLAALLRLRRPRRLALTCVLLATLPYAAYAIISDRAGARERSQADFDAACAWIAAHGDLPGPILTRQPGEAFWLTGRKALGPPSARPEEIDQAIDRYHVAYLLVDQERYVGAPANPLAGYAARHPQRVKRAWAAEADGVIAIYEVLRDRSPAPPIVGLLGAKPPSARATAPFAPPSKPLTPRPARPPRPDREAGASRGQLARRGMSAAARASPPPAAGVGRGARRGDRGLPSARRVAQRRGPSNVSRP